MEMLMSVMLMLMSFIIASPILYKNRYTYYKIKQYGIDSHRNVNHLYDGKPYKVHLKMVHSFADKYIFVFGKIPLDLIDLILAAAWMHDTIEDCRLTYNDVKAYCGGLIAEIVFALSNEKGKTRKDRANSKYYGEMVKIDYAPYLKICDRLANIKYSKDNKSTMFEKYKKEHKEFKEKLYDSRFELMFIEMETLLNIR